MKRKTFFRKASLCLGACLFGLVSVARAEESPTFASTVGIDTLWVMIAAFMVFIMQAGFGMLEAGLIRAKTHVTYS